jgi:hypothetical protein
MIAKMNVKKAESIGGIRKEIDISKECSGQGLLH